MDTVIPTMENRLLASIPADSRARLLPHLERVVFEHDQTLHEVNGRVDYVHFPCTALVSAFVDTANGATAEVALIGNEGAVGMMALICGARAPFRVVVDRPGDAYRIKTEVLRKEMTEDPALHQVMLRYLTVRMVQMAGNVVCNGHHSLAQRVCRALLMRLDKGGGDRLFITQEKMADILGVRRAGVTKAAAHLRRTGAITYRRGHLTVLDRKALETGACECHSAINQQIEFLSTGDGSTSY